MQIMQESGEENTPPFIKDTFYMTQLATQLAGANGELDIVSIKDIPGYANLINWAFWSH